jgi:adenylate cyclase class 1
LYLYIETLKQRLDAINQLRVDRALAAMGPAFQQVYSLLPTLLHYHHPLMPGYLDGNVPKGICLYPLWQEDDRLLWRPGEILADL